MTMQMSAVPGRPSARVLWLSVAAAASWSTTATASPWAIPEGKLVLGSRVQYQFANDEFLDARSEQTFPLNGFFQSTILELQGRLGLARGVDVELELPLKTVSYSSDPVILQPTGEAEADVFQENVIDLSQERTGFADLKLGFRYQFLFQPFAMSFQTILEVPLGYDGPAGTFGERPRTDEEFLENVGRFVRPENVQDDVTLGDGQMNIRLRLHAGHVTPFGLFVRGMGGYVIRLDRAGDEMEAELRLGQAFARRWLLYFGGFLSMAVEKGRVIGISVAAQDPTLPAADYGGTFNLLLRELRLERDLASIGGGLIYRLSPKAEINLNYERIVWGRNVSAVHALGLTVATRQDVF
jgi:hypothetical protein